jgi:uncharacterized protein YkwD
MVDLTRHLQRYVNQYRKDAGRGTLQRDESVTSIAMEHSEDQARREQLMDQTMKEEPVARQVTSYSNAIDLEATVDGDDTTPENVAGEIVRRWMDDPASARALMDPIFEHAGFGAAQSNLSVYATGIVCSDLGWLERKKRRLTSM